MAVPQQTVLENGTPLSHVARLPDTSDRRDASSFAITVHPRLSVLAGPGPLPLAH